MLQGCFHCEALVHIRIQHSPKKIPAKIANQFRLQIDRRRASVHDFLNQPTLLDPRCFVWITLREIGSAWAKVRVQESSTSEQLIEGGT